MNPREWLGKQIREYHLTDIMGSGGMSAVFRAMHTKLRVERAIKVLRPDLSRDTEFVRRFEQEARILAILEHTHLIRVFEFFEERGFLFIVMEIAPGESLDDLVLYHGVIPANEMWQIVDQAAHGLQYAHDKGIVHRDLSPDNLMVSGYDERKIHVKVIDFGIARPDMLNSESKKIMETGQTTSSMFLGKLRYCSPEQAMEAPIDHRSDQYSLALIFLESVTGKPAFEGGSPITSLMRRVKEMPPRLSDLAPGSAWPDEVDKVLDRAMQSSPVERYPSITSFTEALGKALGISKNAPLPEIREKKAKKPIRLIELEDESAADIDQSITTGVISLAETMNPQHNLSIYPGSVDSRTGPVYGRVKAPEPSKKFPWFRILALMVVIAIPIAYFFAPKEYLLKAKGEVESLLNAGYSMVIRQFEKPKEPGPSSTNATQHHFKNKQPQSAGEPYWMGRSGVIAPKVVNQEPLKLPKHLIGTLEHPVEVIVQCIVLKDGKPSRANIVKSVSDDLDRLAMEAVLGWKFTAGTYQGRPADIIVDVKVVYE